MGNVLWKKIWENEELDEEKEKVRGRRRQKDRKE